MPISPNVVHVLRLMSGGEYFSGEQLGALLGVSRAAVWKQLQLVDALGVSIERKRGRGYRLSRHLSLLDVEKILSFVDERTKDHVSELIVETELESTNKYLMDRCVNRDVIHGVVVTAERQTAGRGRRGREWYSPFAANVYLSIGWSFHQGVASVEGLSLAVGVAICEALAFFGLNSVELKWPNDVLVGGKKLGGVLIELAGDPAGECHVVVGLGLNVVMPTIGVDKISQPWVDMHGCGIDVDRNRLIGQLLTRLIVLLSGYEKDRFLPYRETWEHLNAYKHQHVFLVTPMQSICGLMLGVTDSGGLRLEVDGEEQVFLGGEVSLRASL